MARLAVERLGVDELDDAPEVHDRDAVRDLADHREVVRDEDVGQVELALQALQQVEDLRLDRDVERRDGLVADDQLGAQRERASHADALALAARELVRIAVVVLRVHAAARHQLLHQRPRVALGLVDGERLSDDLAHRLPRVERRVRILEDHLHLAPQRPHLARGELRDVAPVEANRSGGGLEQLQHQARGRRLAAARLADDAQRLAAANAERHVLDGVDDAAAAREHARGCREVLREVLDLDDRIADGGAHAPSPRRTASRSAQSRRLASGSRWQASECPPSIASSGGRILSQGSKRCGQRGWNGQPGGRWMTDGGRPSIARRWVDLGLHARHRLEQSPGVRVLRAVEHLGGGPVLDRPPGVHHHHGLGRLGDHPEVVGDQDHADVEVALDLVDELEDLRLHRHVERRGRLVGDQHGRVVHAAPSRSSPAGACRPRTGAGSRGRAPAHSGCPRRRAPRRPVRRPASSRHRGERARPLRSGRRRGTSGAGRRRDPGRSSRRPCRGRRAAPPASP